MSEKSNESLLLRGAFFPTLIVGLVAIAISALIQGLSGFWGALLAQFVVVIFFVIHIAVSRLTRNLDPISTMAMALFFLLCQVVWFGFTSVGDLQIHRARNHQPHSFWDYRRCANYRLAVGRNCQLHETSPTFAPSRVQQAAVDLPPRGKEFPWLTVKKTQCGPSLAISYLG